jgi:hypothetical protein
MQVEGILALMIPFAGMAMGFGIFYVSRVQKTKEEKEMLDKGFSPDDIKAIYEAKNGKQNSSDRNPFLWIGAAAGLLFGHWLTLTIKINSTFAYLVCAFLFAGIALLIQNQLSDKKKG